MTIAGTDMDSDQSASSGPEGSFAHLKKKLQALRKLRGTLAASWAAWASTIGLASMVAAALTAWQWHPQNYRPSAIAVAVLCSAAASLWVIALALVVYELKRERVEEEYQYARWRQVFRDAVDSLEPWLPPELAAAGRLGKAVGAVLRAPDHAAQFKCGFLIRRMELLTDQVEGWGNGTWRVQVTNIPQTGRVFCPTDADLAYELVAENVLGRSAEAWIQASTIFPYLFWWVTWPGLYYLESQRDHTVERTFLFPHNVMQDLFPSYPCRQAEAENSHAYSTFADPQGGRRFVEETLWVLCLHWYLGITVRILSPAMIDPDQPDLVEMAERWAKWDLATFGTGERLPGNLACAIRLHAAGGFPSETLTPTEGKVIAELGEASQLFVQSRRMSEYGLDFADAREEARGNQGLAAINDSLAKLGSILGYGEDQRLSPPVERPALTTAKAYRALRQAIGLPID